ncbi:MAG: TonB family protein, partial [Limnohabitans sp.]
VIPQPVAPQVQPQPQTRTLTPVTPQTQPQPSPVVTQAAPSQAAPIVPATASPAPAAAAPAAAGQPRPNPSTATTAVVLPSSDADYLNNPAPAYPRMSKRLGEEGTVTVRALINTEGRAEQIEIRTSSGYPRLDEAALETVKRWRYVPGKRAGVPEAMWFNVPVRFVLE